MSIGFQKIAVEISQPSSIRVLLFKRTAISFVQLFRLDVEYPVCNIFKLFMCAICQVEMKPGEGISVHASSSLPGKMRPWDGPLLCKSCQRKKEAMEGKKRLGGTSLE